MYKRKSEDLRSTHLSKRRLKQKHEMHPSLDGNQNHQQLPQPPPLQAEQQQQSSLLNGRILLMAITAFFATVCIVFVFHICIRYHQLRRARRRRAALLLAFEDQSPNLNLSANRGLDPDLLRSLPITVR